MTSFSSEIYGLGRTHEPLLAAAVAVARPGPVLELGAGYGSTPLLHAMCAAMGRSLLTVDSDAAWIEIFAPMRTKSHKLLRLDSWAELPALVKKEHWAVVLIDHAPAEQRIIDIAHLAHRSEFLVVHDTEHALYNYEPTFAKFRYRTDAKRMVPWTTVLSNVRPFPTVDI